MTRRPIHVVLSTDTGLTILLVSLCAVLFVIYPFVPLGGAGRLIVTVGLTVVLVSGSFSLADRRRLFTLTLGLAVVSLVCSWLSHFVAAPQLLIWSRATAILFLLLTAGGILAKVVGPGRVTGHRIQGAIAVYLMLGLIWAFAYSLIEYRFPGSFELPFDGELGGVAMRQFVYFSFVTLTTLGYGDVTPVSSSAQTLTVLEALVGQLYLVILVAHLVALRIAHSTEKT